MSDDWRSISDSPCVIHSATALPTPGPSLTHTAAADHRPLTSGVSPSSGSPSGVSERMPLIAYLMPTDSSPTISGISSSACSICCWKSSSVNGNSVGESAASSIDGISSGSWRIGRCAYEPISSPLPSWRSYMFVSMSRTIGNSIVALRALEARHRADVDHLVHRRRQRDRRAGHPRDPRAPDAAADRPRSRSRCRRASCASRAMRPCSTSMPSTSVFANTLSAPLSCARSRMIVPSAASRRRRPTRRVEAADDHGLVDERHELLHLGRRDERHVVDRPTPSPTTCAGAAPASAPRCARPRCRRSR